MPVGVTRTHKPCQRPCSACHCLGSAQSPHQALAVGCRMTCARLALGLCRACLLSLACSGLLSVISICAHSTTQQLQTVSTLMLLHSCNSLVPQWHHGHSVVAADRAVLLPAVAARCSMQCVHYYSAVQRCRTALRRSDAHSASKSA
eukprot:2633-Heterococcus_DN1.PRE.3